MRDNEVLPPSSTEVKPTQKHWDRGNFGIYKRASFKDLPNNESVVQIKNYTKNVRKAVTNGFGLYVYGDEKIGKTWALAALSKYALQKGYSVMFASASELNDIYFNKEDRFDNEETIYERLLSVHVLNVTGLGKEFHSDNGKNYTKAKFLDLLNRRKNCSYAITNFASTLNMEAVIKGGKSPLEKFYGDEIYQTIQQSSLSVELVNDSVVKAQQKKMKSLFL